MKNYPRLIILLIGITFIPTLKMFADSPLTSTDFSRAYQNEQIIIKATNANGILTDEIISFLVTESNPVDLKIAAINVLGWETYGKTNSDKFLSWLKSKKGYSNVDDLISRASGDVVLCYAYLKAMDNYFDVTDALKYAETALKKKPQSYSYQIITALIRAQTEITGDWCKVFQATDAVRNNKSLKIDMREEAIKIIFDYMDGYKDKCNNR
jgi:hypothetical protein